MLLAGNTKRTLPGTNTDEDDGHANDEYIHVECFRHQNTSPAVLPQLSMAVNGGPSILSDPPVNLLSLGEHFLLIHIISASQSTSVVDGGGIRGVSELFILDEIMKRIQLRKNLPNTPKPCEYFDLIGGTSTGG